MSVRTQTANATLEKQSEGVLPGVAYTSMKLAVKPVDPSCNNSASKTDASDDSKSSEAGEKEETLTMTALHYRTAIVFVLATVGLDAQPPVNLRG